MRFSIKKVKKLEYMAAEIIFYYILNLSYIFQYNSCIAVHAIDFKDVNTEMEKNFTVLFADFD